MKLKLTNRQTAALAMGLGLMGVGVLTGVVNSLPIENPTTNACAGLQPAEKRGCAGMGDDGHPVMLFPRSGPCSTCGAAAPITITTPDGVSWRITEPGSVKEMGLKYCPANQVCTVTYE